MKSIRKILDRCQAVEQPLGRNAPDNDKENLPEANVDLAVRNVLYAFEFAHQDISDRPREKIRNDTASSGPDEPTEEDDETERLRYAETEERLGWRNGIEQIRDLVLSSRLSAARPIHAEIFTDRTLGHGANRARQLYNFLLTWYYQCPYTKIRDRDLKNALRTQLKICSTTRSIDRLVARLAEKRIIEKSQHALRRRHGWGNTQRQYPYWSINRRMFMKEPTGQGLLANIPEIVEIAAGLQLDRDLALAVLEENGLLGEFQERRQVIEESRTLTKSSYTP